MQASQSTALRGKRVAVLMTDGVEQTEYTGPRGFLEEHGAEVTLLSPKPKGEPIQGFNHLTPGDRFAVEQDVRDARPSDFDALVLPGGVANPDQLRLSAESIRFIREFADEDKPIAAICHGPWTLIDAGVVRAKRLTSWPSLQQDLRNAGAEWTDAPVVVDGKLVTSRKPDDIPAFDQALLEELTHPSGHTRASAAAGDQTGDAAAASVMGRGLGHDQDVQDLGPYDEDQPRQGELNISEPVHNVQDEPGAQSGG